MSGSKHDKAEGEGPFTSDLERNPGIGQSGGTAGGDGELIEGDNTFEGDVENDVNPAGGIEGADLGRTNK